jgi:GDPmannose 4,6-dehydratase
MKKALILGISGQDGTYLARLLLSKGYEVHGISRDAETQTFAGLRKLAIRDRVGLHSASLIDFRNVLQIVSAVEPDEIYNLSGQSSVGLSFAQPMESMESIALATLQILEVIRHLQAPIRYYNAGSGECFGDIPLGSSADETMPFLPRSPYATAKATSHWTTANYRDSYGIYACNGILFNHESPLRPQRFVTSKIVAAVRRIRDGEQARLELGRLDISRDWGYSPEYVEAMWLMLQQPSPDDFVIATGESHTLEEWVDTAFRSAGLDWKEHVTRSNDLIRPSEILYSRGNPKKAADKLGWRATTAFDTLVPLLIESIDA